MDVSDLLDSLNEKQREAVAAPRSNLLVLAGRRRGKTWVLVPHRLTAVDGELLTVFDHGGGLRQQGGCGNAPPYRTSDGTSQGGMWIRHLPRLGASSVAPPPGDQPQDFRILTTATTSCGCSSASSKALNVDEKQWPPRQAIWYINGKKGEGLRATRRDLQQPGRGHLAATIRPIRKPAIAPGSRISPSFCCARTNCG